MSKRNYDEASVVRVLSKKKDIRINGINRTIEVVKNSSEVGNGSWGKIDYLRKVHGYVQLFVKQIGSKQHISDNNDDSAAVKSSKRDKINIANMAKSAMKRAKAK